jgi:hypothetical protein
MIRFLPAVFFLACGLARAGVFSTMTGMSAPAAGGERRYDPMTLKPADLKSCLVDAYSIDASDAIFEAERPKLEQEREELKRLRDAARGNPTNASAAAEVELRTHRMRATASRAYARTASTTSTICAPCAASCPSRCVTQYPPIR